MQASIADILGRPERYVEQVVNIDGVLVVAAFNRAATRFEQVWMAEAKTSNPLAIQGQPIQSDSTLWHGLSRLSAPHRRGYQNYRVHDPARAWVRIIDAEEAPRLEIITAAVYRGDFTLFIGESGVRLEQALSAKAPVLSVSDIRRNQARYLNRLCHVYGTLTLRTAPAAQYLSPGKIPYLTAPAAKPPETIAAEWLDDIAYPQSNSAPEAAENLQDALYLDPAYGIARRLASFPGINQTVVKPAIVVGSFVETAQESHFGAMTRLRSVYLQNIRHNDGRKSFESVIKLKNFA
ncbi:MAG: hypothetical protein OXG60_07000 [Chloroflexi bacterium]|nr:hypothetical protein [Chloroflexota bacterium]